MKIKRILGIAIVVIPLSIAGCGAGSADIPASLPHPRKMSDAPGRSLSDIAAAKGMKMPETSTGVSRSRSFNPTNQ